MTPSEAKANFIARYPQAAIDSLQRLSADRSLGASRFKTIALTESANKFDTYLDGYIAYTLNGPSTSSPRLSNDEIKASTDKFITDKLFRETTELFSEALDFVEAYLGHLDELDAKFAMEAGNLMENDADNASIGMLTELTSVYLKPLTEKVDTVMTGLLRASGYSAQQRFDQIGRTKPAAVKSNYFL